jgi:hypothetical protein
MSTEQQANEQQTTNEQEIVSLANPFAEESWSDSSVNVDDSNSAAASSTQSDSSQQFQTQESSDEEVYDANEYLKQQLGFEDWDSAKSEIEKLRTSPKLDFENETSRKFYEYAKEQKEDELFRFLDEKRKIDRLANAEIKDVNTAADIVKMSMYQKNKELDQSEIDFLFNEKFQKPVKPEQGFDEVDSEYETRVSAWESRINEIDKRLIIEAKLAKPDIERLRNDIVLPDLYPTQSEEVSPEVLEAQQRYMDNVYSSITESINSFDGFSATVKDEGVDFNVAYVPSFEEKQIVESQLREFADNNLDANMIFAERWVNPDNSINVKQMTKDLFLLQNEGKITQKYINEAANKRLALHLKKQSNIDLSGGNSGGTFNPSNQQSEMDKLAAIMFAK